MQWQYRKSESIHFANFRVINFHVKRFHRVGRATKLNVTCARSSIILEAQDFEWQLYTHHAPLLLPISLS